MQFLSWVFSLTMIADSHWIFRSKEDLNALININIQMNKQRPKVTSAQSDLFKMKSPGFMLDLRGQCTWTRGNCRDTELSGDVPRRYLQLFISLSLGRSNYTSCWDSAGYFEYIHLSFLFSHLINIQFTNSNVCTFWYTALKM